MHALVEVRSSLLQVRTVRLEHREAENYHSWQVFHDHPDRHHCYSDDSQYDAHTSGPSTHGSHGTVPRYACTLRSCLVARGRRYRPSPAPRSSPACSFSVSCARRADGVHQHSSRQHLHRWLSKPPMLTLTRTHLFGDSTEGQLRLIWSCLWMWRFAHMDALALVSVCLAAAAWSAGNGERLLSQPVFCEYGAFRQVSWGTQ